MSRKSSLLALATIASLGAFALSSTDALAYRGGVMHVGSGMHVAGGPLHVSGGLRYGGNHGPGLRRIVRIPPRWCPDHHCRHWYWGWRRHYWIAPVVATGIATTYAAAPSWNRCTCLSKEYTPEGAVVFKDTCTNEMAMNPPDASGPAPQQQSYAQPQTQTQ